MWKLSMPGYQPTKEETDSLRDHILDYFDFEKVHRTMVALKWKWGSSNGGEVPDIGQLRKCARDILNSVVKHDGQDAMVGTGGFMARKITDDTGVKLELVFTVAEWDADTDCLKAGDYA